VPAVFGFLQHRPGAAVGKKKRYKKRQIYILVLTIDRLVFFQLQDTLSKWFYDTFTGTATGAGRYGSFIGGA
jgi:hypothetical protein